MIKLIWLTCSIFVFIQMMKYLIKDELDTWEEIDTMTFIMLGVVAFMISMFGPFVIVGYFLYNILEGIVDGINERYKK